MCLAGSYFLISAYDYKKTDYSVIYVVSRSSKSYITSIILPSKAKVGGLAYDGTNVWVSKGKAVASFPYQVVVDAVNAGTAYTMSVPGKTQGITFNSDSTMILTRSYRTKKAKSGYISQVRTYKPSPAAASGKVLKNTALKVTTMPPMIEGMAVYGTYTYALFSSGYYKSCKYPVDRVLALKINKLIE